MLNYVPDGHVIERWLTHRNLARQYDFMNTAFLLWQAQGKPQLSLTFIQELNFYASHYLSPHPGIIRSRFQGNVKITNTSHTPPSWENVDYWLAEFIEKLNELYSESALPRRVAAYALWRLNWVHPFAQGNGRSSRALAYFILCQRYDMWFPGKPVHELIRDNRDEYCKLLAEADTTVDSNNMADLNKIEIFIERLLDEQMDSVIS